MKLRRIDDEASIFISVDCRIMSHFVDANKCARRSAILKSVGPLSPSSAIADIEMPAAVGACSYRTEMLTGGAPDISIAMRLIKIAQALRTPCRWSIGNEA